MQHSLLIGFSSTANSWCSPKNETDWTSLPEAIEECLKISDCHMFYDAFSKGEKFFYCSKTAEIKTGSSTLYQAGNF